MVIWNIILKCSFLFFFVREVHRSWSPLPFPHESGWVFTLPPCEWFGVCPAPMQVVGCLPCPHASGCVFTLSPCEWLGVYLAPMRVVGCLPCPHASGWVFTLPPCEWLGIWCAGKSSHSMILLTTSPLVHSFSLVFFILFNDSNII